LALVPAACGEAYWESNMSNDRGRALIVLIVLLLTLCLAAGNLFFHLRSLVGPTFPGSFAAIFSALGEAFGREPYSVIFLGIAPILAGILITSLVGLREASTPDVASPSDEGGDTAAPASGSALRLLALLQQEGRFIDFLEEDIDSYGDVQVGAAARTIHSGCRKALHDRMHIERIYTDDDGATIEVAAGFNPGELRLTGNVHGEPPFTGTLQHGGWRASQVKLPGAPKGIDPTILAPAEVEIGAGD
jgi:hypothetical protein